MKLEARFIPAMAFIMLTNLSFSVLLLDRDAWNQTPNLRAARQFAPRWVWALALLGAAVVILVGVLRRSLPWVFVGMILSEIVWAFNIVTIFVTSITDHLVLSPSTRAFYVGMLFGPLGIFLATTMESDAARDLRHVKEAVHQAVEEASDRT